ncbi:uncharacterized protein BDZ99DRAFT_409734, partial [Mytilinidion resinicola]
MPEGSAKPVKKRKSWGQVLPEPKTQLPPRKRAKTEDEKEQRRIERVKRNRLAAHNSRERKRAEVEQLQGEKNQMQLEMDKQEEEIRALREEIRALRRRDQQKDAIINAWRAIAPDLRTKAESGIQIPEPTVSSVDSLLTDTVCPRQTSFPSPESMDSMDTPHDIYSQPATPSYSDITVLESDPTRYPAEILCDLQYFDITPHRLEYSSTLNDNIEDLFDLDRYEDSADSTQGFFNASFVAQDSTADFYGIGSPFDAKYFDLRADSGAAPATPRA